jgi:hypothetical protein
MVGSATEGRQVCSPGSDIDLALCDRYRQKRLCSPIWRQHGSWDRPRGELRFSCPPYSRSLMVSTNAGITAA